jgi:hypothetical protein
MAGLAGLVLVGALGLSAMRLGSSVLAGTTFLVTCGVLCLAYIRPVISPAVSGWPADSPRVVASNARIVKALDRKISVQFPEVALGDFLNYIRENTRGRDGDVVPLYVNPVGMAEAEQTLTSPISINLEGTPLKTNLDAAMRQLNLKWSIRDGVLMIAVPEFEQLTVYSDPYLVVGTCLLALVAMGLGAVLGPLACEFPRRSAI